MRDASPRHGAKTDRSVAPVSTCTGNPRTADAASSTRSFRIGLVVQPVKRPSRRIPASISELVNAAAAGAGGIGDTRDHHAFLRAQRDEAAAVPRSIAR